MITSNSLDWRLTPDQDAGTGAKTQKNSSQSLSSVDADPRLSLRDSSPELIEMLPPFPRLA